MFIVWRTTRVMKWRQPGWQIWEAIESKTRTSSAYPSVSAVNEDPLVLQDSMPRGVFFLVLAFLIFFLVDGVSTGSYFLAETVKYAYLLASETDPWLINGYVLNTEAHPLPVFDWREWERQRYGVANATY
jgi:mannosyl-oligosaccharide alpha-1,2-mannosidase